VIAWLWPTQEADRDGGHPDSGLIGARYSRRQRRQVEFFNPVAYEAEPGSQQPGDSGRRQVDRERERRAAKRLRGGEPSDGSGEEGEEEEGEERRQYSFRDRALVTIRPVGQQQPSSSQGGGASGRHDRKRLRHDRRPGSSRLHRTGSRSRLTEEHDEVADPQDVAAELRAVGQHRGGGGGGGGGAPGGGGRAPWDLVQAAGAALPLSHLGRDKAGNAEITPLQVDPSVTFDTVGGLDHYIKVCVGGGGGGWRRCGCEREGITAPAGPPASPSAMPSAMPSCWLALRRPVVSESAPPTRVRRPSRRWSSCPWSTQSCLSASTSPRPAASSSTDRQVRAPPALARCRRWPLGRVPGSCPSRTPHPPPASRASLQALARRWWRVRWRRRPAVRGAGCPSSCARAPTYSASGSARRSASCGCCLRRRSATPLPSSSSTKSTGWRR
jgi:hypothetical protein